MADETGARMLLTGVIAPGGKAPASWKPGASYRGEWPGGYTLNLNMTAHTGYIGWGQNDALDFSWDEKTRNITVGDYGKVINDPDAIKTTNIFTDAWDGVTGAIDTVGGLISAITSPELWKRIGIGAAGVVMVLFAIVFFTKKGIDAA